MVNDDTALPCPRSVTHPAAMAVPFQHRLPETTEVFFILTPEAVTGGAHPMREHRLPPAAAVHGELNGLSLWLHR
jgi:hypothetical protein